LRLNIQPLQISGSSDKLQKSIGKRGYGKSGLLKSKAADKSNSDQRRGNVDEWKKWTETAGSESAREVFLVRRASMD